MLVVRPVRSEDIDQLFDLVQRSEQGLSTLKISKASLSERVDESTAALAQASAKPKGQPYVFVMEDQPVGQIVGTSSVYSKVGGFQPFYSYEIKIEVKHSEELRIDKKIPYLNLYIEHDGPTELGSLFLSPDHWGKGLGRQLSLSRFLFMAEFLERFEAETIAELRGVVHADGVSPVWDALGAHFFQIEYPKADTLTMESKKFIAELMPKHPIYITLLPKAAQAAIGEVHPKTRPARALLEQEGFQYRNFVDIFDGGPTLHCATRNIRAVRESKVCDVVDVKQEVTGERLLLSNRRLDFRAVLGNAQLQPDGQAVVDQTTASHLGIQIGDSIRAVPMRARRRESLEADQACNTENENS